MTKHTMEIKALSLPGAGAAGIGMVGGLCALEDMRTSNGERVCDGITHVAGVSAGAFIGIIYALGGNSAYIREKMHDFEFSNVDNDNPFKVIYNFIKEHGLYDGDYIENFLRKCLVELGFDQNLTPKQHLEIMQAGQQSPLKGGKFRHFLLNLTDRDRTPALQSVTHNTPGFCDEPYWKLIRASMGIPFFFTETDILERRFIDGGCTRNNAICEGENIFGIPAQHWLGLQMVTKAQQQYYVNGIESYDPNHCIYHDARDIIDLVSENQLLTLEQEKKTPYIAFIDRLGVGSTDFDKAEREIDKLFRSGYDSTMKYLKNRHRLSQNSAPYMPSQAAGQNGQVSSDKQNSIQNAKSAKTCKTSSCSIL